MCIHKHDFNLKVYQSYHVTLNRKSQGQGHTKDLQLAKRDRDVKVDMNSDILLQTAVSIKPVSKTVFWLG